MHPQPVIIHERLADWSRQLIPRFRESPIRWSETRSTAELVDASKRSGCPILVINLANDPVRGLRDLDAALMAAPDALTLVLDRRSHPGVSTMARELGATLVASGVVVPPSVVALLHRWLPMARQRAEALGWTAPNEPEPDFWDHRDPLATTGLPIAR